MTETQLKSLIGCILKYKSYEICIKQIINNTIICLDNNQITIEDFINDIYPIWKIYLTEEDDSLVPIKQYLEHYDLK